MLLKCIFMWKRPLTGNKLNIFRYMGESEKKSLVAISQICATNDKRQNEEIISKVVDEAKQKSAEFLFLPECCDFVGQNRKETLELAETLDGSTVQFYRKLAASNKIWISFGGIHEAVKNPDTNETVKIFNTHIIVNDSGEIVAKYRKLHLFDVVTPEMRFRESEVVKSGEFIPEPLKTPIGNIGLQICYDIRFPEVSLILRKRGAEILTYPSAFAYSTGKAHWEVLLRTRAIENQCYVIAPAQIGFHNTKRQSYGYAMIIDPWGKIIANCEENNFKVATAEIDLNSVERVRTNMPCFSHRRNDIYSLYPLKISASNQKDGNKLFKFGECIIPEETVFFETEHSYAFTNIRCVVPGHVLIATKRSIQRLTDMTIEEITDFFQTVCKVQKVTGLIYSATSSTVTVQDGEHAGQTVKHVHCHVMPRHEGDFEHNDQIYIELNKHDAEEENQRRPLSEMISEASVLRKYF